jgi:hypothetical protein
LRFVGYGFCLLKSNAVLSEPGGVVDAGAITSPHSIHDMM